MNDLFVFVLLLDLVLLRGDGVTFLAIFVLRAMISAESYSLLYWNWIEGKVPGCCSCSIFPVTMRIFWAATRWQPTAIQLQTSIDIIFIIKMNHLTSRGKV